MSDGSVEILACGSDASLDELAKWLKSGPPMAKVAGVEATDVPYADYRKFTIG